MSMPKNDAVFNVQPLHVSASAALSLARANDNDYHFIEPLANDIKVPEYNGHNTIIARESGQELTQPATTHVTYFLLININPAERTRYHINHHVYG